MIASESHAFSHGFDYGISLRLLFRQMSLHLPLYIFTDSKSIFDKITASKRLREIRLMNEISEIRRAYKSDEITNIAWIRSQHNAADCFTDTRLTIFLPMRSRLSIWISSYRNGSSKTEKKTGESECDTKSHNLQLHYSLLTSLGSGVILNFKMPFSTPLDLAFQQPLLRPKRYLTRST